MIKTILISQFPLPFDGIGSWTTMYNYYLQNTNHNIDIIISPKPNEKIDNISYHIIGNSLVQKASKKISGNRYYEILKHLKNIIDSDEKYIIQLIDNHGLATPINDFLVKNEMRSQCYLQFFYHGFPAFYGDFESRSFFKSIDEHVMLTMDSYREYKSYYSMLPCKFSLQNNGIDRSRFKPLSVEEKIKLKKTMGVADKTVVIWCSQDRPKKGLDLILDVWKRIYKQHDNIVLWVIGALRDVEVDGVKFHGKVPNNVIHTYYQAASIYLYPSLNKEGFGLSLIEALSCGNLCVASDNGGIPEVLNYGEYGVLVKNPNFIEEWVEAIESILKKGALTAKLIKIDIPKETYTIENWCKSLDQKIASAKMSLEN